MPGPETVAEKLSQGIAFHRKGALADAERCYLDIVARDPAQGEALNC
jgi:hypothetical protein